MAYVGMIKLGANLTVCANLHTPSTGAAVDGDAVPGYRVYEDLTTTPLLTGSLALHDDSNTVGFYSAQLAITTANGFEAGKSYCIRITGVVGGVTGVDILQFDVNAATLDTVAASAATVVAYAIVNSGLGFRGLVSAAEAGVSFTIATLAGLGAGAFIDANTPWYAYVLRDAGELAAAPQGEYRKVTGYTSATGLFTTEAFTAAVAANDDVIIQNGRLTDIAAIKIKTDYLPSATAGATSGVAIVGSAMTLAADAITAATLAASAGGEIADAVWDEVTSGHIGTGTAGKALADAGASGDPWAAAVRTLTQPYVVPGSTNLDNVITAIRGDTFSQPITGLGSLVGYTKLKFTVKTDRSLANSASIIQIVLSAPPVAGDGLQYINRGVAATKANGSIVITDPVAGDIILTVAAAEMEKLTALDGMVWDVEVTKTANVQTLGSSTFNLSSDVTRAT